MSPYHFDDHPHFRPDFSPTEILILGAFGGSYFRPIYSSVVKKHLKDEHKTSLGAEDLRKIPLNKIISTTPVASVNRYKVLAGQSLEVWERSGWIHAQDPYGQFQWFCRYFEGRRTEDDDRQICRALRVLMRFGQRATKTPKIKQTLLHWGWDPEIDHSKYITELKRTNICSNKNKK